MLILTAFLLLSRRDSTSRPHIPYHGSDAHEKVTIFLPTYLSDGSTHPVEILSDSLRYTRAATDILELGRASKLEQRYTIPVLLPWRTWEYGLNRLSKKLSLSEMRQDENMILDFDFAQIR